jgi:hypothetical protein
MITGSDWMLTDKSREEYNYYTLLVKRMNGTCDFRRVRRPAGMKEIKKLDYDSMESSSDEEETVCNKDNVQEIDNLEDEGLSMEKALFLKFMALRN